MSERYWENEWQYKRILEILDDYWITSKDEILVNVEMQFLKKGGQFQRKCITWKNTEEDIVSIDTTDDDLELPTVADITDLLGITSFERFWEERVEHTKNPYDHVKRSSIGEDYQNFCYDNCLICYGKNALYKFIRAKGIEQRRRNGIVIFKGIRLKAELAERPAIEKEIEEEKAMEEIVWFNKEKVGGVRKSEDISIKSVKSGISIIVRNDLASEITNTTYFRIGFSKENRNRLYFMAADPNHGWKFSQSASNSTTMTCQLRDERVIDGLRKFEGDYNLEISDDNFFFIDRRNVL